MRSPTYTKVCRQERADFNATEAQMSLLESVLSAEPASLPSEVRWRVKKYNKAQAYLERLARKRRRRLMGDDA